MVHFRGGEPLVASSAKNLLGDSTYLRLDLDETRPAELYSGYPADGRREARQQCFKSQQKPALSFAPRKNGAAQLQRKNSIDLWHIPSAKATEKTLSRDVTASCIRCRKMRQKKKKAGHERRKGARRYQRSKGIEGQRFGRGLEQHLLESTTEAQVTPWRACKKKSLDNSSFAKRPEHRQEHLLFDNIENNDKTWKSKGGRTNATWIQKVAVTDQWLSHRHTEPYRRILWCRSQAIHALQLLGPRAVSHGRIGVRTQHRLLPPACCLKPPASPQVSRDG